MALTQHSRYIALFSVTLLLQSMWLVGVSSIANAQTQAAKPTQSAPRKGKFTLEPPKGQPAPKVTIGGGRRNSGICPQDSSIVNATANPSLPRARTLLPLLPTTRLGLTIEAHPTFLIYVPSTSARILEFKLEDQDGEEVYQTTMDLSATPGVVRISLPAHQAALQVGKDYKWTVSIACQPDGVKPQDPLATGAVRRIQPDSALVTQLQTANAIDRVELYARSGIWFEAVASLAELRRSQPHNQTLASAWEELLQSAGLSAIATAPFMN
ncbi:DUF928 domain-containing protein [Pantanalinema rosaneae CENA516]|uniref:DUF928 domain-containing protein n=1 Tax=Pantanalinema rosaneae TaxID=1620701 RepID=UPI003D6F10CE